ncbi:MAG: HAMP domain-containing histidine kinase [Alphaproteobacteria bacterium]|nr:HAMP domain-containing histidine kinase [Alphaproteobacteria bacterium]
MLDALTGELRDPALEQRYLAETHPTVFRRAVVSALTVMVIWIVLMLDDPFIDGAYQPAITGLRFLGLAVLGWGVWTGLSGGFATLRRSTAVVSLGIAACWLGIAVLNGVVDNHRPLQVALYLLGIGFSGVFSSRQLAAVAAAVALPHYAFHLAVGGSHPLLTGLWLFVVAGQTLAFHRLAGNADRLAHVAQWQLAERVADREHLVAAVGHELRAPLATMRVLARLLDDPVPEHRQRWVGRMNDRIDALDDALLAVMRLGSLSSVETVESTRPVQVAGLWAGVADELQAVRREGTELVHEEGMVAVVQADAELLRVALRNLLTNALRYCEGRVHTRTWLDAEGHFHFEVHDDGPGVPEAQREEVFEPVVRSGHGRKVDEKGVGLGLAVVRRVARAHGGAVTVTDGPLGGALFDLWIPRAPARETAELPAPPTRQRMTSPPPRGAKLNSQA